MRTADLLDILRAERVKAIAKELGVSTTSAKKSDLVKRIALSLAHRTNNRGERLGWENAIPELIGAMTGEDVTDVFRGTEWKGDDFTYEAIATSIGRVGVDERRRLLVDVALAEQGIGGKSIDDICGDGKYANCFTVDDEGDDEEDWENDCTEDDDDEGRDTVRVECPECSGSGRDTA
ncbi:MAG: hypothetical protein PHU25_01725 [Deltaproteobacteria bacterium]|nr:hypothetical protein [Deltaproteobacteria bacterium]